MQEYLATLTIQAAAAKQALAEFDKWSQSMLLHIAADIHNGVIATGNRLSIGFRV